MKRFVATLLALLLLVLSTVAYAESTVNVMFSGITRDMEPARGLALGMFPALDQFKAENPDITINEEFLTDQSAYQQKIYTLAAANNLPEVYRLKGSWMSEFVNNGWALDLTDELNADTAWSGKYKEGSFAPFTRDGRIYSVPDESMVTSVVFWNKQLWSKAGYEEFPKTWEELVGAAAKFQEMGIPMFCLGNKANWPAESCWLSTIGDHGTGLDWTNSIIAKDGVAKFSDPSFVQALTKFQELAMTPGAMNADINSLAEDQAREVFFSGKCGAIVDGSWFISTIQTTNPDFIDDIGVTILPSFEGGAGKANEVSGGPAWSEALSPAAKANDEVYAASMKVLKAMTSEMVHKLATEAGTVMSGNVEYDASKLGPIANKFLDMMADKATVPIYDAFFEAGVIETMNVGLQEMLIGAKTAQDLADEIQREQDMVM